MIEIDGSRLTHSTIPIYNHQKGQKNNVKVQKIDTNNSDNILAAKLIGINDISLYDKNYKPIEKIKTCKHVNTFALNKSDK